MDVDVLIAGAGISGLACAFYAKSRGLSVCVCEVSPRPGGKIRSTIEQGYLWEAGPHTFQSRDRDLLELIDQLGLSSDIVYANPQAARRYIIKNGKPIALPHSAWQAVVSPILSPAAKFRLLAEPLIASKINPHESVYDFFSRRFGREVADYPLNAFVRGIYAGDPRALIMQSAFPRVLELEQSHGSIFRGLLKAKRQAGPGHTRPPSPIYSFRRGMQQFIDRLSSSLGDSLVTETSLESLRIQSHGGFEVTLNNPGGSRTLSAAQVVLALPAQILAEKIAPFDGSLSEQLRSLEYPPLAVVATGFKREAISHALDGFGCLCPEREKRFILGSLWLSTLFPGRAPEGKVLLTAMIGGSSEPDKARLSDTQLLQGVLTDYRELLGLRQEPEFVRIVRWEDSIPQYSMQQFRLAQLLDVFDKSHPELSIIGNFRGGVSVGACVTAAKSAISKLPGRTRVQVESFSKTG